MAKISGIYVEIRGDSTQLKKELAAARQVVTEQAQGMSNALNNALSPAQLKSSINGLVRDLNTLSNASKLTGKEFGVMGADLGELRRLTGLSETQFASLQAKMLQTASAQKQEQALRNIARAAGLSTDEIQRLGRQMGVSAAGISAVTGVTQQAEKAVGGLATIAQTAAGVFAGMALAKITSEMVGMVGGLKESAMLAARYETLGVVMGVVGNNAGYTRAEMDQFEASLRKTGITAIESRNNLSAMASANMDLSKASQLARMAQDAAVVGNVNSSEAFKQMIFGIKSAQVEVLRTIGINVSFENSYKKTAEQLGKNTADLNENEKMQSRLNAVLAQAPSIAGVYEESLTTVGKKLASTSRYSEDAQVKIGAIFQPAMVLLVDTYTAALKGVNAELDNTDVIEKWARVIKSEILDIMQMGAALNMVLAKAGQAASVVGMGVYGPGSALGIGNSEKGFDHFAGAYLDYQKQFADSEAYLNKLIGEQEKLSTTVHQQTTDRVTEQARISAGNARRAEEAAAILNSSPTGKSGSSANTGAREAKAREAAHAKMIADGKKAADALEKYWNDYEDKRVDAIADSMAAQDAANEKNLALVTEFADKYKEIVLGETEFKMAQIDAQADAYRSAGADEIAVAQYVKAEKLKYSREWQDGATRALQAYVDEAGNSAMAVESVMNTAFQGMEDMIVEFVKTGKFEFADFVTSINAEIARLAFKSLAGESYSFLGDLLKTSMSAVGSYFSGGASLNPSVAPSGASGLFYSAGHHAGGIAGSEPTFMRAVDSTIFSAAKKYHTGGLVGDEVPIIAKRGEGVFTEGQMKALGGGGGNSEMTGLLREIAAGIRAQKATKVVNAIGKGAIANELSGSEGEQVIFNHIRRNPQAVRRMLGL
jgi:lambda family phage tail tape measure protein